MFACCCGCCDDEKKAKEIPEKQIPSPDLVLLVDLTLNPQISDVIVVQNLKPLTVYFDLRIPLFGIFSLCHLFFTISCVRNILIFISHMGRRGKLLNTLTGV